MRAVKLCKMVKPVPSVLILNITPSPELPPAKAAPYKVLPDMVNLATGEAPSLLKPLESVAVKLCRFVKAVPSVLTANTVPLPEIVP